jgi:predicted GNAT family acetyltransferase
MTNGLSAVRDDPENSRFVLDQDGATAELVYDIEGSCLTLVHTEVPEALGGRGIGGQLVKAAVARARAERLTVLPWCPFARRWLARHPDAAAGTSIDWSSHPPSP